MSGLDVQLGVGLPQVFVEGRPDPGLIRELAARAEDLGCADLWSMEPFDGPAATLEGLELLCFAAASTRIARLGISVLVLPRYNPLLLAKRLATIDQLSEGRLIVGVGVGPDHERFRGFGLPSEARGRRLEESLDVMKALWGQTTVDHRGEFWTLADAAMGPKPRQRPHPPIWFGGSHPSALRRAAQLGDGWMGMGASSPEEFAQESMLIRDALKRLGKDPGDFTVSKRVYIAVTKEPDRARRRTSRFIAGVYGDEAPPDVVDRCCLIGDAEACVEGIDRLVAAGAEHLVLNPVFDPLGQLAALAEVVAMSRAA